VENQNSSENALVERARSGLTRPWPARAAVAAGPPGANAVRIKRAVCGHMPGAFGQRTPERTNSRNGYRPRELDTRTGTIELAIPKLRSGTYFPAWLLEPRKRAEKALTPVVATCCQLGMSTRRMDKLPHSPGISGISKSQVSMMAKDLDVQVEAFRRRRLDHGPYTSSRPMRWCSRFGRPAASPGSTRWSRPR
jgi:hypothetical protein